MNAHNFFFVAAAAVVLLVAVFAWRERQRKLREVPAHWPLSARLLANSEERGVWKWVREVFDDQLVMVKLPVTRFTMPRNPKEGIHWYRRLIGVYCTFTICSAEGRVIGCIDVASGAASSRSNRRIKYTLLTQCGIGYWVVRGNDLPSRHEVRAEFLGEAHADRPLPNEAAIAEVRHRLRAAIDVQRRRRHSDFGGLQSRPGGSPDTGYHSSNYADSVVHAGWQETNSFVAPLDSRKAGL